MGLYELVDESRATGMYSPVAASYRKNPLRNLVVQHLRQGGGVVAVRHSGRAKGPAHLLSSLFPLARQPRRPPYVVGRLVRPRGLRKADVPPRRLIEAILREVDPALLLLLLLRSGLLCVCLFLCRLVRHFAQFRLMEKLCAHDCARVALLTPTSILYQFPTTRRNDHHRQWLYHKIALS